MNKFIFLDIDGVLNCLDPDMDIEERHKIPDEWKYGLNPNLVSNLKKIIEETNAKLVISSTWRYFDDHPLYPDWKKSLCEMLGMDQKTLIIGKTANTQAKKAWEVGKYTSDRGFEIQTWIQNYNYRGMDSVPKNMVDKFICIDDEVEDIKRWIKDDKHIVHTNYKVGLTEDKVQEAITKLNGD